MRPHAILALCVLFGTLARCNRAARVADEGVVTTQPKEHIVTRAEAIEIARRTIDGHIRISSDATLEVAESVDRFVIEWRRHHPPQVLGPDYDARVTVDRVTGKVLEFLVGS